MATSILEGNLRALARASPAVAARVVGASPRPDVRIMASDEPGTPAAEVGEGQSRRALCSRRRPMDEARTLAATVDIAEAAVFLVSGFGAGHHVRALAERLRRTGVVVVFEPDLGLLRAVLEGIDCSGWLGSQNVAVVDSADDTGALAAVIDGLEGLVAMGVALVEHPASRARLGGQTARLHTRFVDVVKAVKMTVVTTLVQVKATMRNLTQNLDRYVASPGIAELKAACAGRAAIVVSAGPSLSRNVALLEDPAVRAGCVIVAVQTVLKPLLARGVRPHFVTALDYSEISARFYEGLSADDLRGITLVADPKVNPKVLEAWPRGAVLRVQQDRHLDRLLGPDLTREKGSLPAGATVAHLAYYLARHLGCDPVALIGQDLGFTDGQYYAAGAAIHETWACELNPLNTLEMLEWQRIMRMGMHLRRAEDVHGRPIYTDEQMATYLVQFERDFKADRERGLRVVDATEGGVRKQHAAIQTLGGFIEEHAGRAGKPTVEELLERVAAGGKRAQGVSLRRVEDRVARVRADAAAIAAASARAGVMIAEMLEHAADQARVNRLIGRLDEVRDGALALQPAFDLAQTLNQTGVFNRLRADRALQIENNAGDLSGTDRQKRQLERDGENVRMLEESARGLGGLLDDALVMLRTGARVVREEIARAPDPGVDADEAASGPRPVAVIPVYSDQAHLGERLRSGLTVLETTVARLGACSRLGRIVVLTDAPASVDRWLVRRPTGVAVEVVRAGAGFGSRRAAVRAARILARECWRGGIANQSIYDEVFDPGAVREGARTLGLESVLLVGADWAAVDPTLCGRVIERHMGNPGESRFAFTQGAPGLCGCVLSRALIEDLAAAEAAGGVLASIGGLLGYMPTTPIVDVVNLAPCVAIESRLRDLGVRAVADSARGRRLVEAMLAGEARGELEDVPAELVLMLGAGARRCERWMDEGAATRAIDRFSAERGDEPGAVTLRADDPLSGVDALGHPAVWRLVGHAKGCGLGVHVRTSLTGRCFEPERMMDGAEGLSIVSVDLLAESEAGYSAVTGRTGEWEGVRGRLDELVRRRAGAWSVPWVVPRLTRCDAAYGEVDAFFRARVVQCGWAVIDPPEGARAGERIGPLPAPEAARRRLAARQRVVRA